MKKNRSLAELKADLDRQTIVDDYRIRQLEKRIEELKLLSGSLESDNRQFSMIINELMSSRSWKLTKPLRMTGGFIRAFKRSANAFVVIQKIANYVKGVPRISTLRGKRILAIVNGSDKSVSVFSDDCLRCKDDNASEALLIDPVAYQPKDPIPEIPKIDFDSTFEGFTSYCSHQPLNSDIKTIAFYLPQFHPIPENDEWWGKGFTEWTNVGKAQPNYLGHYQPHCPIHLGYYDLRLPEVMREQARLAKNYGIYGFNYYFYWFGGKTLLETPLNAMLDDKSIDIPFCLTWANENWTRRWDGAEHDVLMAQNHSDEDSLSFIKHLMKFFNDDRYIKINGKPLLIVYRANIIPDIRRTADIWRDEVARQGFPGLYLVCAQTFGITSPDEFGFDSSMEFPPHTVKSGEIASDLQVTNDKFQGSIFSYQEVVNNAIKKVEPEYKLFRTAMLSWDNTARKQDNGHIFHGFSLRAYKQWFSSIVDRLHNGEKYSDAEKFVFVNAWNEWAEGTHLEPDRKFGYGYLQATWDVLKNYDNNLTNYITKVSRLRAEHSAAVIIHVHYFEVWNQIAGMLSRIFEERPFDLYVTVTDSEFSKGIQADCPYAQIILVENRGRDILPFIRVLRGILHFEHSAVCKIHTKKSLYREDGDVLRDNLLTSLLGDTLRASNIVKSFEENPKLGMLVPEYSYVPHTDKNMFFDSKLVEMLSSKLDIGFKYDFFPAGSMFWFRPSSLAIMALLSDEDFDVEVGLADGTTAHAVERLFCVVAQAGDYSVEIC